MTYEEKFPMSYEECLEFCSEMMCVMGYFPNEIEAAAKEMFEEGPPMWRRIAQAKDFT
jgi:hypothetical protein